jgi:hypothetical protein
MTQYRNESPEHEENEFDEQDKEFFFSVLVSVSVLFTVVVLACTAAWFLVN